VFNFFDKRRVRTGASLRFIACCGEAAARPVVVKRNALTACIVLALLLARRKVSFCAPPQEDLALVHVTFLSEQPRQVFH